MELRFHRDLYTRDGVESAITAFSDFLDMQLENSSEDVFIVKLKGEGFNETLLEFQNYALGASIEGI